MIKLKPPQLEVFLSPHRFRMVAAGRRFGKTYLALIELLRAAMGKDRIAWYVGPTNKQAKRIVWDRLKDLTRPFWDGKPIETDLRINLKGGGTIAVRGADAYDSLRGEGIDFVVLDEYASMAPEAWHHVLRPMLADRQGQALFIGTPQGFNHFYKLYTAADTQPDWASFHFTTEQGGNVAPEELTSAAREMDERLYKQEFCASFEQLNSGRVYWAFDRKLDVESKPVEFDPRFDLCWSLDFNIGRPCSVLCQVIQDRVIVLDELALLNTPTEQVCREFLRRTKPWVDGHTDRLNVQVFGDATGESRKSSASRTDWQFVHDFFDRHDELYRVEFNVPRANPRLKDRTNCVNAVILNAQLQRRLRVSSKCQQLIRDLEQVCWKTDANGNHLIELDDSDPSRTHMSDALGYLIERKFPMRPVMGEMPYSIF